MIVWWPAPEVLGSHAEILYHPAECLLKFLSAWLGEVCPSARTTCPSRLWEWGAFCVTCPPASSFLLSTICGINAPERPYQCPYCLLHAASASGGTAMTFEEILDQAIAML